MRFNIFSALLTLLSVSLATPGHSFDIEHQQNFVSRASKPEVLRILSTADIDLFTPMILSFQRQNPEVTVNYDVVS